MHKRTYSTEISFEHLCDETKAQVFVGLAIKGRIELFAHDGNRRLPVDKLHRLQRL